MSILGTSTLYSPCPNCTCGRREALQNGWEMPRNLDLRKSSQWRNVIKGMLDRSAFDHFFGWSGNVIRIDADSCRHDEKGDPLPFIVTYTGSVCNQVRNYVDRLILDMNQGYHRTSAMMDLFRLEEGDIG